MLAIGDKVFVEWTWGGSHFNAAGVVTKVSGKTVKVRLTEHAGEHFVPGFIVTAQVQNVRRGSNMQTTKQAPRMDAFTRQYFETALWSSTDESDDQGGEPLDKNYGVGDIADETRWQMIADCADFQKRYEHMLDNAYGEGGIDSGRAGHNFWLSRNGRGAGFFDDDLNDLQEAAKSYGEFDLYIGDDGEIHGSPLGAHGRKETRPSEARGRHVADMDFTKDDLKVFRAFLDQRAEQGRRFSTDGQRLDGGAFLSGVATWEQGERGEFIETHDLGSRNAQQIHRKLRKMGGGIVRDYEAVDNHDRHIAGPFKSYGDARQAAGTAGVVKFVPSRGKAGRAAEVHATDKTQAALRRLDHFFGSPSAQKKGFQSEDDAAASAATLLAAQMRMSYGAALKVVREWYRQAPGGTTSETRSAHTPTPVRRRGKRN